MQLLTRSVGILNRWGDCETRGMTGGEMGESLQRSSRGQTEAYAEEERDGETTVCMW